MPMGNIYKAKTPGLSKTQAKTVRKIALKTARGLCETKAFTFRKEDIQLIHNISYYSDHWLQCKQGTADDNSGVLRQVRIGDELLLKSINIRFWLSNKHDRPNVMYKAFLFWYDTDVTLTDAVVYFTQTNKMLDRINNESISVIDQQTIFSGPQYADKEHSYLCTLKSKWKGRKITYDEGGTLPKKRDIGFALVCYDAKGTLQTDNIASFAYDGRVTFIDP